MKTPKINQIKKYEYYYIYRPRKIVYIHATCDDSIFVVDWDAIFRSGSMEKFIVSTSTCPNVGLLRIFPGITVQTVSLHF